MKIQFSKMQSLGNDFVVIDATQKPFSVTPLQIQRMADRRLGIGFDQLLVLEESTQAGIDFNYRIFNADGGEVGQCGNGARCMARFIELKSLSDKKAWKLSTISTILNVELIGDQVRVEMPVPNFLATLDGALAAVDLGNPHVVFQVEAVDELDLDLMAAPFAGHSAFPQGVNVSFVQIIDEDHIRLRVYERGVGTTLACGSGACAAVVAARSQGRVHAKVQVDQPGGRCQVEWEGDAFPVYLIGPAEHCFEGNILLE